MAKDGRKFIENSLALGWERYDSRGEEGESVNTDFIDCPEVAGKTIQLLRIHRDLSIASLATGGYAKRIAPSKSILFWKSCR